MSIVLTAIATILMVVQQPNVESQPPTVQLPFENLTVFDALPNYTEGMSDEMFAKWAKAQNAMAHRKAQQKADEWMVRNPSLDTYVQSNDYTSRSTLDQMEKGNANGASVDATSTTQYNGDNVQRTYRQDRWGGGPVVIVNPFCRSEVKP